MYTYLKCFEETIKNLLGINSTYYNANEIKKNIIGEKKKFESSPELSYLFLLIQNK